MERLFILFLRGSLLIIGSAIALVFVALMAGLWTAAWTAVAICVVAALIASNTLRHRRDTRAGLVGPTIAVVFFAGMAGFLTHELLAPETFPSPDPSQPTETVELPGLQLVGQWPPPARLGPGWEVSRRGESVTVRPGCEEMRRSIGRCGTRYPRPDMTIRLATNPRGPDLDRRIIGDDGRVLHYQVTKSVEHRTCTSTMSGILTLDETDYQVACTYTTEDGCGGGGKWCLELLATLKHF